MKFLLSKLYVGFIPVPAGVATGLSLRLFLEISLRTRSGFVFGVHTLNDTPAQVSQSLRPRHKFLTHSLLDSNRKTNLPLEPQKS